MEDNSKLFVFDKKEVILIFVFIVLIAITSFTLGVRFGKQLSLKSDEYTKDELDLINLKSSEEERVEDIVEDDNEFESSLNEKSKEQVDTDDRLREEIERLTKTEEARINVPGGEDNNDQAEMNPSEEKKIESTEDLYRPQGDYSGKYTIQLAAFDSKDEARSFADGFIVSGYDAIVNEVEISGKGTWYRVSIGLFENLNQAKDYLEKEKSFFQGKDYLINKIE